MRNIIRFILVFHNLTQKTTISTSKNKNIANTRLVIPRALELFVTIATFASLVRAFPPVRNLTARGGCGRLEDARAGTRTFNVLRQLG
jgi:hypothetical protein